MKILIGEIDGRAGDREGEQRGDHRHRSPLRSGFGAAAATDAPATVAQKKYGSELPEQRHPRERQVRQSCGERDQFVEDGRLELDGEEFGIVWKKRCIEIS